jgi:hypothetical protein
MTIKKNKEHKMARPKKIENNTNETIQENKNTTVENKPVETVEKTKPENAKTKKIKVLSVLRGTYGSFNPNEIIEIDAKTADLFIKSKYAVEA